MRRNKINDPKNILKRKLSDKVNLALYNGGGGYFGTYNKKEMPLDNTLKLDFVQKSKTISKSKRKIHGNKSRRKMLRNKSRRKMLGNKSRRKILGNKARRKMLKNKTKRKITRRKSNRGENRRMTKVNPR